MARSNKPTYEVGYKQPPIYSQYKKGQSGNLNGRPKRKPEPAPPAGMSEEDARILRLLGEEVTHSVDGQNRTMTRAEAVDRALIKQASAGDHRAIKLVLERHERALAAKARLEEASNQEVNVALIREFTSFLRSRKSGQDSPSSELPEAEINTGAAAPDAPERGHGPSSAEALSVLEEPPGDNVEATWTVLPPVPESSCPERPVVNADDRPALTPSAAPQWGNSDQQLSPARLRERRKTRSSEPLINCREPTISRW